MPTQNESTVPAYTVLMTSTGLLSHRDRASRVIAGHERHEEIKIKKKSPHLKSLSPSFSSLFLDERQIVRESTLAHFTHSSAQSFPDCSARDYIGLSRGNFLIRRHSVRADIRECLRIFDKRNAGYIASQMKVRVDVNRDILRCLYTRK